MVTTKIRKVQLGGANAPIEEKVKGERREGRKKKHYQKTQVEKAFHSGFPVSKNHRAKRGEGGKTGGRSEVKDN